MSIFGSEFEKIWPLAGSQLKLTEFGKQLLKKCASIEKPAMREVDIQKFQEKSSKCPLKFPIDSCRVLSQPVDRYSNIKKQISSAYPVIHERCIQLYLDFIEHKCQYGTSKEQLHYKNIGLIELVQRLLDKRCVAFLGGDDYCLLLSGHKETALNKFMKVGTKMECEPFTLENVLSYDEIKLSALLSVSSHTEFINDGNRYNEGAVETNLDLIEREGVVIGLIGARFEKPFVMEYQDIVISEKQNIECHGYGFNNGSAKINNDPNLKSQINYRKLWNKFYEENDFLYPDPQIRQDTQRFQAQNNNSIIFDNIQMKKRYALSFDTLLLEAQKRAAVAQKQAYIHIVGIGLGVWKIAEQQTKIFLECFTERVKHLLPQLSNVGVLHFSWFHMQEWRDLKHDGLIESPNHAFGGIRTFLDNRNPNQKLKSPDFDNMLSVVSYAWDGNALPGNEFWLDSLCGSNDPSTAASTLISELHNPHVNSEYVCGSNLHIASLDGGVVHISDYVKNMKNIL